MADPVMADPTMADPTMADLTMAADPTTAAPPVVVPRLSGCPSITMISVPLTRGRKAPQHKPRQLEYLIEIITPIFSKSPFEIYHATMNTEYWST